MNETMQNEQTVALLWRFYTGAVSGIVIASNEDEALERTKHYLSIQFDDISKQNCNELVVWKVSNDDDFRNDYPFAVAVAY